MRVLITGANGLLATHTIEQLLQRSYIVRGFLRKISNIQIPYHPQLELSEGDILDPECLKAAMKDCDAVIHAAAITAPDITDSSIYYKTNYEGTQNVMGAALSCGVETFIYVSTANTLGYGSRANPGDENKNIRKPFTESHYALSKLKGEEFVMENKNNIHTVIVNPTFMLGEYDSKPSSGKIIQMGFKKIVFYPPGGKNFVNAQDAAQGVCLALEKGENGNRYLLSGENLSYREFFSKLNSFRKGKSILIPIPSFILLFLGRVGEVMRYFNIRTALSINNTRVLCIKNYYSNHKATRELGVNFRPLDYGIKTAIKWFKKKGML